MTRRSLLIAGLALVPITFVAVWCMRPTDPISAANFDRIEDGMTEQEVKDILGSADALDEKFGPYDHKAEIWSRPGRDTIIVGFKREDGKWIVDGKRCFFPTLWEHARYWWDGSGSMPGGKAKKLEQPA